MQYTKRGRNDDTWECGRCGKEIQPLPQSLAGVQLASGDGKASLLFCSILKRNRNVARLVHSGLLYPTFGDVYFPSLAVGKRHERPVCAGSSHTRSTHISRKQIQMQPTVFGVSLYREHTRRSAIWDDEYYRLVHHIRVHNLET